MLLAVGVDLELSADALLSRPLGEEKDRIGVDPGDGSGPKVRIPVRISCLGCRA